MTDLVDTLAERGARYGDFTDHAAHAQSLLDTMRNTPGWANLSPVKRQSLTVIADKIARILSGDPEYRDNWHDIAGYAKLAEDRCVDTSAPGLPLEPVANDADGWIEWADGEMPVPADTIVTARLRKGSLVTQLARLFIWSPGLISEDYDIIAYKVVE